MAEPIRPVGGTSNASPSNVLLPALGAVGAGFGALGILTFVGGAISLARFRGAGLSGTQGVSVVPKQELLALGADQLLLPMVIAFTASALIFLTCYRFVLKRRDRIALLVGLWILGELYFLWKVGWPRGKYALPFAAATVVGLIGALAAASVIGELAEDRRPTGRLTREFFALSAIVFATVTVVVSVANYGRSLAFPVVRPAAVAWGEEPHYLWGFYVGQTADRIYIGLSPSDPTNPKQGVHAKGRLIGVPNSTDTTLSIGALQPLPSARNAGPRLREELLRVARSR